MGRNVAIQVLRGLAANIPVLGDGEFYFATDAGQFYVGFGGINFKLGAPIMAAVTVQGNANPARFIEPNADGSLSVQELAASLAVTATGASGAGVTATLPAVASQFHYITLIEILKYAVAALTGGATPVVVTSTNLPGAPAFTFGTAAAIGTTERELFNPNKALKSSVINTATTIVCPATTNVIWRVNVWYVAAP